MKQVKNVAISERDTEEHAAITFDEDAIFKKTFGWNVSEQAKALRTFIKNEAPGLLKIGSPIVVDDTLIVGYECEASYQYGHSTAKQVIPLHTVEQARIAVHELIKARVKLLISDLY